MAKIDLGDLPGWIQAVTTIGALAFAWIAAKSALNLYRIESARDEHRARAERESQASRVCVWMEPDLHAPVDEIEVEFTPGRYEKVRERQWRPLTNVKNGSELPVYAVTVYFYREDMLKNGETEERHDIFNYPVIPPGGGLTIHTSDDLQQPPFYGPADHAFRVEMSFRDAANNEWHRHPDGKLSPRIERPSK
ncbi:hypothetical protein [Micromonospora zamorensis]|uniref:hypothetical protein n=1 Tax=Micromonospora zamorensis TaxID=709883 RepID=UPI0033FE69CC